MKDQKKRTHRGFDWQDELVLWACVIAVLAVVLLALGGVIK